MQCDICGKEGAIYKALIESVEMDVCEECSKLGKKLNPIKQSFHANNEIKKEVYTKKYILHKEEEVEEIIENFGEIIKSKRERMGLKQKDLANMIAEKESLLHNIESGHFEPNIETAKKLEKFLNIKLIEKVKEEGYKEEKDTLGRELTLGDLIDVKKRIK